MHKLYFNLLTILFCLSSVAVHAENSRLEEASLPVGEVLTLAPKSWSFEAPLLGIIDTHAIATGMGMIQTNPIPDDYTSIADLTNAQIILKKDTGVLQFYLQGGYYSTPSLGTTYQRASVQTGDSFGLVPLASISLAPSQNWLLTGGKINSFGGNENTFTFQNNNIDRGLLWNQTSNVSKGFQASYKQERFSTSITLNDGFYSNQLNWMGAAVNYQINAEHSLGAVWTGAIKSSSTNTFITPVLQNNSQIANLIYTYRSGHWSVSPYLQYTYVPQNASLGILSSAQTAGAAVLANYRFNPNQEGGFNLPVRFEYIGSSGKGNPNSPNLLYGPGSAAWSATITPTYQYERIFVRGELSYVQTVNAAPGAAFGPLGSSNNQTRIMLETGILY